MDVLREAREKAGLSQIGLAREMGRTENYINLVENGQRLPNVCEFMTIAQAMGADPAELIARAGRRAKKG